MERQYSPLIAILHSTAPSLARTRERRCGARCCRAADLPCRLPCARATAVTDPCSKWDLLTVLLIDLDVYVGVLRLARPVGYGIGPSTA